MVCSPWAAVQVTVSALFFLAADFIDDVKLIEIG